MRACVALTALFFCFGTTHFCDTCHTQHGNLTGRAVDQLPCCPAGPGGVQLERGQPCPLGLTADEHPARGQEFCMGCDLCATDEASDACPRGLLYQSPTKRACDTNLSKDSPQDVAALPTEVTRATVRGLPAAHFRLMHWLTHAIALAAASGGETVMPAPRRRADPAGEPGGDDDDDDHNGDADDAEAAPVPRSAVTRVALASAVQRHNGKSLGPQDPVLPYFMQHVIVDWRMLRQLLNCSSDKLCLVVHALLHEYRHAAIDNAASRGVDAAAVSSLRKARLVTADDRMGWEQAFSRVATPLVDDVTATAAAFRAARQETSAHTTAASLFEELPPAPVPTVAGDAADGGADAAGDGGADADAEGADVVDVVGMACRFCEVELTEANRHPKPRSAALAPVCNDDLCVEAAAVSCPKALTCGHPCSGINGDACLPCMHDDCREPGHNGGEAETCIVCRAYPPACVRTSETACSPSAD